MKRLDKYPEDLSGLVFGRLTALLLVAQRSGAWTCLQWRCKCSCGNSKDVPRGRLTSGNTRSCGCYHRDCTVQRSTTHGENKSPRCKMLRGAKHRADKFSLPFNLSLEDIQIPDTCPVFGIPLVVHSPDGPHPDSPTLDRVIPSLGYVKGNIRVICHRANALKGDATLNELKLILKYMGNTQG